MAEKSNTSGKKRKLKPQPTPMRLVERGTGPVASTDEPLPRIGADDVRAVTEKLRR